jgi:hypothetical protein
MVMPLSEMGRNGESQGDLRNLIWWLFPLFYKSFLIWNNSTCQHLLLYSGKLKFYSESCCLYPYLQVFSLCFLFWWYWVLNSGPWHLLDKCSPTWVILPAFHNPTYSGGVRSEAGWPWAKTQTQDPIWKIK